MTAFVFMGSCPTKVLLRTIACIVAVLGVCQGTEEARAGEQRWYEAIFNSTSVDRNFSNEVGSLSASSDSQSALQADPLPLRSDEMLDRIDNAITRYEEIVKAGSWSHPKKLRFVRRGQDHETLPSVRRQLVVTGDIPDKAARYYVGSKHFDEWLEHGVKRFQRRHGLRVTGRLDHSTRMQLSVSPKARLRQLKLNRRRVAQLVHGRNPKRYVLVNIPGFQLEAVEGAKVINRYRVIVGKPDRQTPTLDVMIRAVNFLPFWRVPDSIAKRDLIPRLVRDPEYLAREHIRAARGSYNGPELNSKNLDWRKFKATNVRFRQAPGPWNALGLVRIDMPNKDIVYLHDTPLKSLFKHHNRAFSAGCVRVQNILGLVAWLAKDEKKIGTKSAVKQFVESINPDGLRKKRPKNLDVRLNRPVPVKFVYITAWVQKDGKVQFRSDIYRRDGSHSLAKVSDAATPASASALSP